MWNVLPLLALLTACGPPGTVRGPTFDGSDTSADTGPADTGADTSTDTGPADSDTDTGPEDTGSTDTGQTGSVCPPDTVLVGGTVCMDRYEAPNVAGASPLVMLTFTESAAWCAARGKRLCFDDEWQEACEGSQGFAYPYGSARVAGKCNDEETWLVYTQSLLSAWPYGLPVSDADTLDELFAIVRAAGASAAADHVEDLYQGEGSGTNTGCVGEAGVYDLVGNVEEWTRRRDGGTTDFHGKLKGRYWAESRTCQQGVTTHGDAFRFYEIGFRCCVDP